MRKLYLGIDFHKNTSTLCTVDEDGKEIEMVTLATKNLHAYLANKSFALIGIEASGGVNHAVQKLKDAGHEVRILNSNTFRAVGLGGKKTDERDARAIAASLRVNFGTPVHHKSERSRVLKSMLVGREHLVQTRVDHVNHVRGTLREYGITMPVGMEKFLENAHEAVSRMPQPFLREHLEFLLGQIIVVMAREAEMEKALEEMIKGDTRVARLRTIPGVGTLGSIALVCVIDDISRFEDCKQFASYLGLVPKEHSSGGKRMLGSITRSGSEIARRYLIHGARAVLLHTKEGTKDANRAWALRLKEKSGQNKAVVAMAHRLARIAWSVLKNERDYTEARPSPKKAA
jgi:transposase